MKRIICSVLIATLLLLTLCSCQTRYLPVWGETIGGPYFVMLKLPTKNAGGETTLEFWIGETVKESDWEGYTIVYDGFLGEGYTVDTDRWERNLEYVHYTVRNYPKVDSTTLGITEITITDPSVKVYGLTTESSFNEFAEVFESLGAEVNKHNTGVNAKFGDVSFQLSTIKGLDGEGLPKIRIRTDQTGIVCID